MIVKTLTKTLLTTTLTGNEAGRRDRPRRRYALGSRASRPHPGRGRAVRLRRGRPQGGRRCRYALLALICGLLLAGCVMPQAAPTRSGQGAQSDQGAKVAAIQTRVAAERAAQAADKEDATDNAGAQGQTAAVAESGGALSPGPTAAQLELLAKLRPQGEAPELLNEVWLNSEPLKLADLRGNVVLVEFWTYG